MGLEKTCPSDQTTVTGALFLETSLRTPYPFGDDRPVRGTNFSKICPQLTLHHHLPWACITMPTSQMKKPWSRKWL